MRVEKQYRCEICCTAWKTETAALECEAKGWPAELPVGTIIGDSASNFYERCVFAVARNVIKGHYNNPVIWVTRDNGGGDDLDSVCETEFDYSPTVYDPEMPAFKRMVAALCNKGIVPRVWNGEKAVPVDVGCPITHQEAMRIAQETLETAERERIDVARAEAERGIQYEDETGD